MSEANREEVPRRIQAGVYGVGLFSTSIFYIGSVIMPLYLHTMNPSPLLFGLMFSLPHVLPLVLSIHGGAMMDRLGARQVMLAITTLGAVVPLLYPLAPSIWALMVLQMLLGLSESMGWLGAQTMIGQYMQGRTLYAGRLSAVIRDQPVRGAAVGGHGLGHRGAVGGFHSDVRVGVRRGVLRAVAACASAARQGAARGRLCATLQIRLRDLMPKLSDYITAFQLLPRQRSC